MLDTGTNQVETEAETSINIAVVGTYLPRQCGIAAFTADLTDSIERRLGSDGEIFAIAMDDTPEGYDYPARVRLQIRADMARDYRMAADYLNISPVDVVILQHEFGIFGGEAGSYINTFFERLRKPIIATVHTVLDKPAREYRRAMDRLVHFVEKLVVMSHRGFEMLRDTYNIPEEKIVVIPHGIPDLPFVDPNFYKDDLGLAGRRMILTFGLLGPGKGIEVMIRAVPKIAEKYPDVAYVILGATHPNVKRQHGERYRNSLIELARKLGVENNVIFINRFVELDELCRCIGAADIYATPYPKREQITSGTLAYAVGAGKSVVSTAYWHAEELLADGRGRLVDFNDSDGFAREILWLFDHDVEHHAIRKRAYLHARQMIWPEVGLRYLELADEVRRQRPESPRSVVTARKYEQSAAELPEINLEHLNVLTDHVGILQHAKFATPDRDHGYCIDDNARALLFTAMHWSLYEDPAIIPLMHRYLSFTLHAFNRRSRRFRNFLSYDQQWMEQVGSEDSRGRAIWGLGTVVAEAPNHSVLGLATTVFHDALHDVLTFSHTRAIALTLLGIQQYLRRFNVDTHVRRIREQLARDLMQRYREHAVDDWVWCSDILTYSNARVPHALFLAGQWLPDNEMVLMGLRSLRWLLDIQTGEQGQLSVIGNDGWYPRGGSKARFDQQPIEAMCLVQACLEAYSVTAELGWLHEARRCFEWFLGRNDLNLPLYDFRTGGGRDGLTPASVNQNQGAESTLAWLISLTSMHLVSRQAGDVAEEKRAVELTTSKTVDDLTNKSSTNPAHQPK